MIPTELRHQLPQETNPNYSSAYSGEFTSDEEDAQGRSRSASRGRTRSSSRNAVEDYEVYAHNQGFKDYDLSALEQSKRLRKHKEKQLKAVKKNRVHKEYIFQAEDDKNVEEDKNKVEDNQEF